jgi:hypothetical protein
MNTITTIPERLKTADRVLFNGKTTATAAAVGILPKPGKSIAIVCSVTMANAADLTLSVVSADDAAGTTPVAITEVVPVYVNDVRQADAKSHAITEASVVGKTVVFCIPSNIIPADKYLCLSYANSDVANILSAIAIEDTIYEGDEA